jgi:class 3 adenylate cyclase
MSGIMFNKIRGKKYSLQFSIGSAFAGIVVLTSIALGMSTYYSVRSFIRQDIRQRLHDLAGVVALQIDGEEHKRILLRSDEKTETYLKIKKQLQAVRDKSEGVRFVYTIRRDPLGKIMFVVDAEEKPEDLSHVGDAYEQATPLMIATFDAPYETHVENKFYTDQWGTWLSAYAPIFSRNGDLAGVVGMDVSAKHVLAYENQFLLFVIIVCAIVTGVVISIGVLFSRSISKPLLVLSKDMNKIQRFELDETLDLKSRVIEINSMRTAVENMKNGLRSFRKYVPADLVAELIQLGKEAVLSAEKREVTVFLSDITDFTTVSEKLSPEELAAHLRRYFRGMSSAILKNHGTIDKYIGDAIMAFWGAPHPLDGHAIYACRSALECQWYLEGINREWAQKGVPTLSTRIGLNTGQVVVGNFGYEERLNYTAMGDNVNLASRLEGLNKYYGTRIIISESTYAQVSTEFEARMLDVVAVKGKTKGIAIYELVAEKGTISSADKEFLDLFNSGMREYLDRRWGNALSCFKETSRKKPEDRPSLIFHKRCSEYLLNAPPDDWTGVIVMQEK